MMKINAKTALNNIQSNPDIQLLDVRTASEFQSYKIDGAVNIPLDALEKNTSSVSKTDETILICESGMRAQKAHEILSKAGFTSLSILEGGMKAWKKSNAPCEIGKNSVSLERQVRIAAGALVAIGTALGVFVNGGFLAIPAFVGCGLVFAGITDSCAMGMMIAKMPWNKA